MDKYTGEELKYALKIISSVITKCKKIQPKFVKGTSQRTLLKRRIKAMHISKDLMNDKNVMSKYTNKECIFVVSNVSSKVICGRM